MELLYYHQNVLKKLLHVDKCYIRLPDLFKGQLTASPLVEVYHWILARLLRSKKELMSPPNRRRPRRRVAQDKPWLNLWI